MNRIVVCLQLDGDLVAMGMMLLCIALWVCFARFQFRAIKQSSQDQGDGGENPAMGPRTRQPLSAIDDCATSRQPPIGWGVDVLHV